mgnify:FL=1
MLNPSRTPSKYGLGFLISYADHDSPLSHDDKSAANQQHLKAKAMRRPQPTHVRRQKEDQAESKLMQPLFSKKFSLYFSAETQVLALIHA